MKLFCPPLLRIVVLMSASVFAFPAMARAENPLTNIGGKIKNGVSNVGSAIKKSAKAAKNMVTPGRTAGEKSEAPRSAQPVPKKSAAPAAAGTAAKTKKPASSAVAAAKPASDSPARAKAKTATASGPAASASKSKPIPSSKPQSMASNKTKPRKNSVSSESRETEDSRSGNGKPRRDATDTKPGSTVAAAMPAQAAETSGESPDAAGRENNQPGLEGKMTEALPFGTPAFGRKGFVYSPYAPDQGLIDVKNVAAGAKVRCPYTGKVFRVP